VRSGRGPWLRPTGSGGSGTDQWRREERRKKNHSEKGELFWGRESGKSEGVWYTMKVFVEAVESGIGAKEIT